MRERQSDEREGSKNMNDGEREERLRLRPALGNVRGVLRIKKKKEEVMKVMRGIQKQVAMKKKVE